MDISRDRWTDGQAAQVKMYPFVTALSSEGSITAGSDNRFQRERGSIVLYHTPIV